MNRNYVIFDMDGTIIDSMPYWDRTADELLESYGVKDVPGDVLETIFNFFSKIFNVNW